MSRSDSPVSRLIRELHRRRVFATAGLYVVAAWLVMQAADVFFPAWGVPDRGINALLVAAVAGFPLVLVFGWFFNVTVQGIRRTSPAGSGDAAGGHPLRGGDYIVLTILILASGVIVSWTTTDILAMRSEVPLAAEVEKLPNSIAVMPFANVSSDPENEYFCDGISEEILNRLARYKDLNVIGRTSSWQFKGSGRAIPDIAGVLGVHNLLQGSVQKVGDRLRISARLVDDAGTQVWGETFDRTLDDVFKVQSRIAELVATTVAPRIVPQPGMDYQPDLAAYDHFLRGRELLHQRDWGAGDELRQAVELDPGFAEAYAELAIDHLLGNPAKSDRDNAREAIDTALTLVPGMPRALAAKGLLLEGLSPPDYPAAEVVLRQALEQEPHMVDAMNWLAGALTQQGKKKEAKALFYRAHGYDPLHPAIATNLAQLMVEKGDAVAAKNVLSPLLEMPEPSPYVFYALRELCKDTGQLVEMNEVERRGAQRVNDQHYGLALSYAMLAMWDNAEYWMVRSYREFPDFPPIAIFPSQTDQWRGRYAAGLEDLKQSVAAGGTNPTDLFWYAPIYGRYLAMAGDYQAAIDILQPYFEAERNLPGPRRDRKARHALAFALLRTGENERAKALLEPVEDFAKDPKYSASFGPAFADYYFARNAALLGKRELALERLRKAIDAGWRGYYIKDLEPLWDTLKDDPRYQAMMAEVKADVDRQRVAVEQLDAKQDLPALVDDFRAQL